MDFVTAVTTCLKKYVDFGGRARRSEYWWFFLAQIIVIGVMSVIHDRLGDIAALALLLPALASGVRRLHDIGKSGWFLLLWIIPIIGWVIMIYWAAKASQPEDNEWGAPPA